MPTLLIVSAGALVDADGRVLIAQRPEGRDRADLWEFPGGKLERDETPEAALVRELKEELDVDVEQSCLAPIAFASEPRDGFHLLMPLFVCRKWRGTPKPLDAAALAWVRPRDMLRYALTPADRPLAAQLSDIL